MNGKSVTLDLSKLLSWSNLLKIVAILLGGAGIYGAVGTVPKVGSSAGVPFNDFLNTILPALGGVVTWFLANRFKIKPALIQSVVAVVQNPTDAVADLRLGMEVLSYFQAQWPNSPMLGDLQAFVQKLSTAVVEDLSKQNNQVPLLVTPSAVVPTATVLSA